MRNIIGALIIAIATPAIANTKPIELERNEVIVIHDRVVQPAKAQRDPRVLPPYSDKAIESNEWTRAWLLLDIDATGSVRRVKFVHKPGLDLETIALKHAFTTHFEPALDRSGAPVSSQLVWGLEWPAHSWLVAHGGSTARLPLDVKLPICRGDGPLNLGTMLGAVYRDCTQAEVAHPEKWGEWLLQPR